MLITDGGVAELVDALDSKSCGFIPCQFKSDYPYQIEKPCKSIVCEALFVLNINLFLSFFKLFQSLISDSNSEKINLLKNKYD